MILKNLKSPQYISPSSYMAWKQCNYYTWLTKCSGLEIPRRPQTVNAAFGTAFDAAVKSALCTQKGLPLDRTKIWDNLDIVVRDAGVIDDAITMANEYLKLGICKDVTQLDLQAADDCTWDGVPIFGYPDAATGNIPFDWKTSGYKTAYSPGLKPGYAFAFNINTRTIHKPPHPRNVEPLDHLNPDWGIQLAFYSKMLGNVSYSGIIHHIVLQKKATVCAIYNGRISDECIAQIEMDLPIMWEQMQSGELAEPEPSPSQCYRYGSLCEAAEFCSFWKAWREEDQSKARV